MKLGKLIIFVSMFFSASWTYAKGGGGMGINVGLGAPFLSQAGFNIGFSDKLGLDVDYGLLDLSVGLAKVKLAMPSLLLRWHPFSGAFFIGAGVGQESFTATATDALTGQTAEIKVTAMTTVGKLGWMWGAGDGGRWFGIDASFISPSSPTTEITSALPSTDQAYIDAQEQADKFGSTAYNNITFARIGYLF